MNARKHEPIRATPGQRLGIVIVGVLLMLPGIAALVAGSLFYTDHRNLLVFAPFFVADRSGDDYFRAPRWGLGSTGVPACAAGC